MTTGTDGAAGGVHAPEAVSPARWAGVTLVIGALLSAVVLAAVSPAEPGTGSGLRGAAAVGPTPLPSIGTADGKVPTERPVIDSIEAPVVVADDGVRWTREREIGLAVTIPPTELRPRQLRLIVLVDGQPVRTEQRPRGEMAVTGVRLAEGRNAVTLRLASDGGEGPPSDAQVIWLDTDPPGVTIRSPRDNAKLTGDTITVAGQSEVGARVRIVNQDTGDEKSETIGPSGTFEKVLRSTNGRNRIVVSVQDVAGNTTRVRRSVTNAGSRAIAQVTVRPRRVRAASLPTTLRIRASVTDAAGTPIRGAAVTMTLSVPGGQGTQSFRQSTNRDGLVTWDVGVDKPVSTGESGTVTLVAKLPDGRKVQKSLSVPAFY